MLFERGEVVLLDFSFSSETGGKQRPALILLDANDQDPLVARVTTQQHRSPFDIVIQDWNGAGLFAPSIVRLHKLATVEKRLVRRRLGRLAEPDWSAVRTVALQVFGESRPV